MTTKEIVLYLRERCVYYNKRMSDNLNGQMNAYNDAEVKALQDMHESCYRTYLELRSLMDKIIASTEDLEFDIVILKRGEGKNERS